MTFHFVGEVTAGERKKQENMLRKEGKFVTWVGKLSFGILLKQNSFSFRSFPCQLNRYVVKPADESLMAFAKDTPSWLQKLLSFRYRKPNQIPIEGIVSNPEFEPNQISATRNQSRMRTGQASILVKVIKMSKYWRKTSKNKVSGVNLGCPCQGQYDYLLVRAI